MAESTTTAPKAKRLPKVKKGVQLVISGTIDGAMIWKGKSQIAGEPGDAHVIKVATNGAVDMVHVPLEHMKYFQAAQRFGGVAVQITARREGDGKFNALIFEAMNLVELIEDIVEYDQNEFDSFLNS